MSLSDIQTASRQVVLIQKDEMGKIKPIYDSTTISGVGNGVSGKPNKPMRRRRLRRR